MGLIVLWLILLSFLVFLLFVALLFLCELLLYSINQYSHESVDYGTILSVFTGRILFRKTDWWRVVVQQMQGNVEAYLGTDEEEAYKAYCTYAPHAIAYKNGKTFLGWKKKHPQQARPITQNIPWSRT